MIFFLALYHDNIILIDEKKENNIFIKDFFFATLHPDGKLCVFQNENVKIFSHVKPSGSMPCFCRDLRLFFLEAEIVLCKKSCLIDVLLVRLSTENATFYHDLCRKHGLSPDISSGQDIILCRFIHRYISLIVSCEDSNYFFSILKKKNSSEYGVYNLPIAFQQPLVMSA